MQIKTLLTLTAKPAVKFSVTLTSQDIRSNPPKQNSGLTCRDGYRRRNQRSAETETTMAALPYADVDFNLRALAGRAEGFGRFSIGGLNGGLYRVTSLAGLVLLPIFISFSFPISDLLGM